MANRKKGKARKDHHGNKQNQSKDKGASRSPVSGEYANYERIIEEGSGIRAKLSARMGRATP